MSGSLESHVSDTCWATRSESPKHLTRLKFISLAIRRPCRKASYSAALLVQGNIKRGNKTYHLVGKLIRLQPPSPPIAWIRQNGWSNTCDPASLQVLAAPS